MLVAVAVVVTTAVAADTAAVAACAWPRPAAAARNFEPRLAALKSMPQLQARALNSMHLPSADSLRSIRPASLPAQQRQA
jgi:hypothetical protein